MVAIFNSGEGDRIGESKGLINMGSCSSSVVVDLLSGVFSLGVWKSSSCHGNYKSLILQKIIYSTCYIKYSKQYCLQYHR